MKALPVILFCLLGFLPPAAHFSTAFAAAPEKALADTSLSAHFPGGIAAFTAVLDANLRYPEKTMAAKTEGYLAFTCKLTAAGKLMNFQAFSGVEDKDLVWEAMRLLTIPQGWIPYTSGGQPVDQEVYICLYFRCSGQKPSVKASFNVQPPSFPGGNRNLYAFLGSHLTYPKKGRKYKDGSYTVYVNFMVDETGRLNNIGTKGEKSGYGFEEAAIKAVNAMPNWHPCIVEGKAIPAKFVLPVRFRWE